MNEIRKNRNRDLFIHVAHEIIEEQGIEAATIRNIAAKAGYNSATLYSYFKNLSHIFLCVHMEIENEIMVLMQEAVANAETSYFEIWPQMYVIMAKYYLAHPNAFECSYLYKNEISVEEEIMQIRNEQSKFQQFVFECLKRVSTENEIPVDQVMLINQTCISIMVGTLLMAFRKRINNNQDKILNDLQKSFEAMIHTLKLVTPSSEHQ